MNKELLEKLGAIREDLRAFSAQAQAGDVKKLADLVKEKMPTIVSSYNELFPYTNDDQKTTIELRVLPIYGWAEMYFRTGKEDRLTVAVEKGVPLLLADLDDIERKLKQPLNPKTSG